MLPRPMKAISAGGLITPRGGSATVYFLEGVARDAEAVDPSRNAAIDGDLQEDLLDLLLGKAVFQRRLDVQLQLMGAVERADHRQIDNAAAATVKAGAGPKRAPA